MMLPSARALAEFAAPLMAPETVAHFARQSGRSHDAARRYLDSVCNEAQIGLQLLRSVNAEQRNRTLEVGAGGGMLTAFLQSNGCDVVAIEPVGDGFDATRALMELVCQTTGHEPKVLPIEARALNPTTHGLFDCIFSVNVIEHFQPLEGNLDGIARVMAPGAVAVHTCANYSIPYEPHFNIPLVPFAPHLTKRIFASRVQPRADLWRSLNFITARDLRHYARRNDLEIRFLPCMMADALERLGREEAFSQRHPAALHMLSALLTKTGLISLVARLPPELATPMTVILHR